MFKPSTFTSPPERFNFFDFFQWVCLLLGARPPRVLSHLTCGNSIHLGTIPKNITEIIANLLSFVNPATGEKLQLLCGFFAWHNKKTFA
jgi:hypothetical protein